MAGRVWTKEMPAAYRLTSSERAELAELDAIQQAENDALAVEYRAMVAALGQAMKSENPDHPLLPALRAYYAECRSYDNIVGIGCPAFPATFAGQDAVTSIVSMVLSSQKRGLPVPEYFAGFVEK